MRWPQTFTGPDTLGVGLSCAASRPRGTAGCDNEFGGRIEGDLGGAADDELGSFPGPLAGYERVFLGHPVAVVLHGWRPAWLADPDQAAALGFALVGLDPDRCVEEVRVFAAGRAHALDGEQRAARWYLDRPGALALAPLGRALSHRLPGARGQQDAVGDQAAPAEPGVPPGDIVSMRDTRPGDDVAQPSGQGGLSAGAAPVHGQHNGTVTGARALAELHDRGGSNGRRLGMPRPGFGFIGGQAAASR